MMTSVSGFQSGRKLLNMEGAIFSRSSDPKNRDSRTWARVESPEAARLLTDLTELRYLEPFLRRECTVKEAADTLGVPLDTLYFRVRRAERLGVLRVSRLERRAGRAVKRYTTSADGFFVPFLTVPDADFEGLVLGFDLMLERLLIRNSLVAAHNESKAALFGFRVFLDDAGRLKVDAATGPLEPYDFLDPRNPATYTAWQQLQLGFEDAKALQFEMDALWRKYARRQGSQEYLVRFAMAPLLEP
jgi:hypothetical protein